jgi:hypothetical protein
MAMEKVIKEFKNKDLTYKLGCDLYNDRIYHRVIIKKFKSINYNRFSIQFKELLGA